MDGLSGLTEDFLRVCGEADPEGVSGSLSTDEGGASSIQAQAVFLLPLVGKPKLGITNSVLPPTAFSPFSIQA